MKNLKTKYLGLEIDNPIVIGASNLVTNLDLLKKAEEMGAAAVVYKSLFEEQIQLERLQLDEKLTEFNDIYAEMLTIHPNINFLEAGEHLLNLRKAKESISIPLIASLNAVSKESWIKYAVLLSETGVNGIELNFHQTPWNFEKNSMEIENEQLEIISEIKQKISLPISVKLSDDYTNVLNFTKKLDQIGVNSVVLFNAFLQPDIDINTEKHISTNQLSYKGEYKKSLRYTGLLYDNIKADICSCHGIYNGADAIKLILSGASSVQVVSTLYRNGLTQITKIKNDLEDWMELKEYNSIDDFKGKLSNNKLGVDSFVYKRAQYIDLLMNVSEVESNNHALISKKK